MTSYAKLSLLCATGLMMSQISLASKPAASPPAANAAASSASVAQAAPAVQGLVTTSGFSNIPNYLRGGGPLSAFLAKYLCPPSKELLTTKAVYKEGDYVRVVHGVSMASKGKVLGSFASRTGKSTTQDVLDALKQNKRHMLSIVLLLPNKLKYDMSLYTKSGEDLEDSLDVEAKAKQLEEHPYLLDPHRLYEVEITENPNEREGYFNFIHASCLEKISKEKHDRGYDSADEKYQNDPATVDFDDSGLLTKTKDGNK